MTNTKSILYRPHHFMCTLGFQGKGYSPAFVENFQHIADRLRGEGGDEITLTVTRQTDSICAACPHQNGRLCGSDEEKIQSLDARHEQALRLQDQDTITWGEAKRRIVEHIDEITFDRICDGCSWKDLGLCLSALRELKLKS
jgi:uncharacterized protein